MTAIASPQRRRLEVSVELFMWDTYNDILSPDKMTQDKIESSVKVDTMPTLAFSDSRMNIILSLLPRVIFLLAIHA